MDDNTIFDYCNVSFADIVSVYVLLDDYFCCAIPPYNFLVDNINLVIALS